MNGTGLAGRSTRHTGLTVHCATVLVVVQLGRDNIIYLGFITKSQVSGVLIYGILKLLQRQN